MRTAILAVMAGVLALTPGPAPAEPPGALEPVELRGTVLETRQASAYTYVRLDTGGDSVWAAVPTTTVNVGDIVNLHQAVPMADFYSPTFHEVFESLYLATSLRVIGDAEDAAALSLREHCGSQAEPGAKIDVSGIEPAEGGKTVQEIWSRRQELAGSVVRVRGRVVKCTSGVMGRNWLHLRDGSGAQGEGDELTITTDAVATVGSLVLVSGTVAVDKDFGYGYRYDLLIEGASVSVE